MSKQQKEFTSIRQLVSQRMISQMCGVIKLSAPGICQKLSDKPQNTTKKKRKQFEIAKPSGLGQQAFARQAKVM